MTFVDSWDSGGTWDSGLQWDTNVGPNSGDPSDWVALVTSEHRNNVRYMAMVRGTLQVYADIRFLMESIPGVFDVDVAIGAQLDIVGLWVGASRFLTVPVTGVFFSLDIVGLGFDQGVWFNPDVNPTGSLIVLPDDHFRTLIRAKIHNNNWDGTIPDAYTIWNILFAGTGIGILIKDKPPMHMEFTLTGPAPDALTLALYKGGHLNVVPAGVHVDAYN